jgi:hypothetical protein
LPPITGGFALGLAAGSPISCARLRFSAAMRSTTGGCTVTGFGVMVRPLSFASISSRNAS